MAGWRSINYLVAFVIEVAALVIYGYFGYQKGGSPLQRILLMALAVAVMVFVWGRYLAPKAGDRLDMPMRLAAKLAVMGIASTMLFLLGRFTQGAVFSTIVVVHYVLAFRWRQV